MYPYLQTHDDANQDAYLIHLNIILVSNFT